MIKPTTLKKKIEEVLPQSIRICSGLPEQWEQMNEQEKILMYQNGRTLFYEDLELKKHEHKTFVNYKITNIQRTGSRIYPKRTTKNIIYIQGNNIKIKNTELFCELFSKITKLFDIRWTNDLKQYEIRFISRSSSLFKAILTGRIYSEETLIKKIASHIFRVKNVEWKELKKFLNQQSQNPSNYFSLCDIRDFTKNFNNSIRILNGYFEDHENARTKIILLRDTLNNAIILNRKIDLNWSDKRVKEEHKKMVRKIAMLSITNKSDKPIHPTTINDEHIRMLNTEKEVFCEGATMSHCVYVNYGQQILERKYLVFHMSYPEECTIGVIKRDGVIVLDQACRFDNNYCQNQTIKLIKEFIKHNEEQMSSLLQEKKDEHFITQDDLPF